MLPIILLAIAALTVPVSTLYATQTVGCQARADLRRRQGCHHNAAPAGRATVDRDFWHVMPHR